MSDQLKMCPVCTEDYDAYHGHDCPMKPRAGSHDGVIMCWRGLPQSGMYAADEELLEGVIDQLDAAAEIKEQRDSKPNEWRVRKVKLVFVAD